MQPTAPTTEAAKAELLNSNSVWGPNLARNFFLPALSPNGPEEWRNVYSLFGTNIAQGKHVQYPQPWFNTSDNTDDTNNDGAPFTIDIAQPEHVLQSQTRPSSVVHGGTGWLNLDSPFGTYNSQPNRDFFQQPWVKTSATTSNSVNDDAPINMGPAPPAQSQQSQRVSSSFVHDGTGLLNLDSSFGTYNSQPNRDCFQQPLVKTFATTSNTLNDDAPVKMEPTQLEQFQQPHPGASSFATQPFYYGSSIATSLLFGSQSKNVSTPSSKTISSSIDEASAHVVCSPFPVRSSILVTPHVSPQLGTKNEPSSLDSDLYNFLGEHERELPMGVERNGMIWAMKVDDYRALSAKERRRVRNRISARMFRAKRREHFASLESTLGAKDLQIKLANEEASRLNQEVAELKRRIATYDKL